MLVRPISTYLWSIAIYVGLIGSAWAAKPQVNTIKPIGLQRGTTTEFELSGELLGDAREIMFFNSGLEATNLRRVDQNKVALTITAAKDADCDLHAFRVITPTGISNLRMLGVSPFSSIEEKEPNNDLATPQPIAMNMTINGLVNTEDVDYYVVEVPQGELITVEMEGLRLAHLTNMFDPFVAILDDQGKELARNDDATLVQQDCICSAIAPETGRYLIAVRDSSYGGSNGSYYRLHVGDYARPVAMIPSGGKPGELLKTTCIDSLGNAWEETFQLPSSPDPRFKVWSKRGNQIAPSPNYLRVNDLENVLESEPNEDQNKLPVIDRFPIALNGILQTANDQDWFVFSATKNQAIEVRLYARSMIRSPVDGVVEVYKLGGNRLVFNDDAGGPDSAFSFKAPEDGKYAIGIKDHMGRGGPHYTYRLELGSPKAELVTTLKEQERYISQSVPIHQGACMAVTVQLDRKFVSGDAKIVIPDLPRGVVQTDTIVDEKSNFAQLILRAAPDAELGGKLVDLSARVTKAPDIDVVGHMNQRTMIVRGQNNRDVWGYNSTKLAVAVLDPAQFAIEVVAPAVPLVRDGAMYLVVKATRKEGFNKPIKLRLLENPVGVSASTSVTIPEGKNQAEIPLTANATATLGKFPITVLATATQEPNDTVTIASEFFNLEIADRIFDFQFSKTMAEQGKPAKILVGVTLKRPVEGKLEVEVVGIPPGTTMKETTKPVAKDTKRITYILDVPANARTGNFKTIICRGMVSTDKGVITQVNGNGEVQIDVARTASSQSQVAAAKPEGDQGLTRLEQLRKQREEQK